MTQEDEDLRLKDLCARLPYRVVCQCDNIKTQGLLKEIAINYNMCKLYDSFTYESENCYIFDCKPYLFPLSSMTKEQESYLHFNTKFRLDICNDLTVKIDEDDNYFYTDTYDYISLIDWLNKNHLDYRGLIEKGLALDATGLNIY